MTLFAPTHSPQPPLPPRRAEEGEPHFLVGGFERFHWVRLPPDLVRQDVGEMVVVNGVRFGAAGWMPDRVGHDAKEASAWVMRGKASPTRPYNCLCELLPHKKPSKPVSVIPNPARKNQMELPLFRPAGRERGLGGVSGGKGSKSKRHGCPVRSGMTRGVNSQEKEV